MINNNNRELESGLTGEECLEKENRVTESSTQIPSAGTASRK
jgi:hypothetical protein